MDFTVCSQCGREIEGKAVRFQGHAFCSDECSEEFEEELSDQDIPPMDDLDQEGNELLSGGLDDLGYRDDNDLDDDLDDDDFPIDDDF